MSRNTSAEENLSFCVIQYLPVPSVISRTTFEPQNEACVGNL
jgi:hypothetical protein